MAFLDIPEDVHQALRRLVAAGVDVEAFVDDYVAAIQAQATDEEVEAVMRGIVGSKAGITGVAGN